MTGFQALQKGDEIKFSWTHIQDVDLWGYEIRRGESWERGQTVVDLVQENRATWGPPLDGTYQFWIKAKDESGIYSDTAASCQITVDIEGAINIVEDKEEITAGVASATLTDLYYNSTDEKLFWIPGMTDTDFDTGADDTDISDYEGDSPQGVYTSQPYDLGSDIDFTIRGDADFTATVDGDAITDLTYPDRTDQSYPGDTDDALTSLATYDLEYRVSDDGVTWSDWKNWNGGPGQENARYWEIRATTDISGPHVNAYFEQIESIVDVAEKEAVAENQAIASGGTTFTLASLGLSILVRYYVGVTVLGTTAVTPVVNKSTDQFTVYLKDSGGSATTGNVDLIVRGY